MTEQTSTKQYRPVRSPMRILDEFRELKDYANDSDNFRVLDYKAENLMQWTALILPKTPPYDQKAYKVEIELPREYPEEPPKLKFLTKIFHPNVSEDGEVKLDFIDRKNWKPSIRMDEVIQALIDLIENPNAESESQIANEECAKLYKDDNPEYQKKAETFAKKNALRRPKPLAVRKSKAKGTEKAVKTSKPKGGNFVHEESLLELATAADPINLGKDKNVKDKK